MSVTVIRCCPQAEKSLCPQCFERLPERQRRILVATWWDGDLLAHATATDSSLAWLRAHSGGRRAAT